MTNEIKGADLITAESTKELFEQGRTNFTDIVRMLEELSTNRSYNVYSPTTELAPQFRRFMDRGVQEGKVYNQLRIGYMFSSSVFKQSNLEADKFFDTNWIKANEYVDFVSIANKLVSFTPERIIQIFNEEASDDLRMALEGLLDFTAKGLRHRLDAINNNTTPILELLDLNDKLQTSCKTFKFKNEERVEQLERSMHTLSLRSRGRDRDTIMFYRSTDIVNPETNERAIKSKIPSKGLVLDVLRKLVAISNRDVMSARDLKAFKKAQKAERKQKALSLISNGKSPAEVSKITGVSVKTISRWTK